MQGSAVLGWKVTTPKWVGGRRAVGFLKAVAVCHWGGLVAHSPERVHCKWMDLTTDRSQPT